MFGRKLLELQFDVRQIGPAYVVLEFVSRPSLIEAMFGPMEGVFVQAINLLDVNHNKIVHQLYMRESIASRMMAPMFLRGQAIMLERDILIWNNKVTSITLTACIITDCDCDCVAQRFLRKPRVVKEEKPLVRFRHWFDQFYSTGSARLHCSLDW